MLRDLPRLARLPRRRRAEVLRAALLLTLLPASLRLSGLAATRARTARLRPRRRQAAGSGDVLARARARRALVAAVAARLPWRPRCLAQSLAVQALLRWEGLPAELRLGVRKRGDALDAHAWVECAGVALERADAWSALGGGAR